MMSSQPERPKPVFVPKAGKAASLEGAGSEQDRGTWGACGRAGRARAPRAGRRA